MPGGARQADISELPAKFAPLVDAHQPGAGHPERGIRERRLVLPRPRRRVRCLQPGTRTGSYRTSSTAQVTNEAHSSLLGVADYAIAFADELQSPRAHRAWLAIGY